MNEQRREKEYESTDAVINAWAEIAGNEFEKQMESALTNMKKDLGCYVASRLCHVDVSLHFRLELCCYIVQMILDTQKYIDSLPAAFGRWRDKLTGDPTSNALKTLYSIARNQIPRQASPDFTDDAQKNVPRCDTSIEETAGNAFIDICITVFDMKIFNTYISKKLEYGSDTLIIHLVGTLAKKTPEYFLADCDEDLWRFVSLLAISDVQARIESVLLEAMNNLERTGRVGAFLARLSRAFMKLKAVSGLLSDRFVLTVIDKFAKSPMTPSFALFARVIFQLISDHIKPKVTSALLEYFARNALANPGDDLPDIVGVVSLLGPHVETAGEHYIMAVFNAALYHPITVPLFSELSSLIKSAVSVGVSTVHLLNLLITRNSIAPCAEILELIAFVLDFSKETIDMQLLMHILRTVEHELAAVSESAKVGAVKVSVNVAIRLPRPEILKLFDKLLHTHDLDIAVISCFITTLASSSAPSTLRTPALSCSSPLFRFSWQARTPSWSSKCSAFW